MKFMQPAVQEAGLPAEMCGTHGVAERGLYTDGPFHGGLSSERTMYRGSVKPDYVRVSEEVTILDCHRDIMLMHGVDDNNKFCNNILR